MTEDQWHALTIVSLAFNLLAFSKVHALDKWTKKVARNYIRHMEMFHGFVPKEDLKGKK